MSLKKAIDIFKIYGNFLITTHINPEGDSLGSQLALYQLLTKMGKKAVMVSDHKVPFVYNFLPGNELIRTRLEKNLDYDVAVVVDCPTLDRVGRVREIINTEKIIVNIDHHVSNEAFGKVNWVEPETSSCGEMVYTLYKELESPLDKDIATNIYVAILTDTGSFRYSNTTSQTHKITSDLLTYGLEVSAIHQHIYERRSMGEIKLLGYALSGIETAEDGKIAYMKIARATVKEHGFELKGTEDFVNYVRSLNDVEVALFFREEKNGMVQVSLRSKANVDVNKIAVQFGGGGHLKASGCMVKGALDDVIEQVITETKKVLTNT